MLTGVKTIIFDLGGVVLNLDYTKSINAFEKLSGTSLAHLYSQANQNQLFDLFETGEITAAKFRVELMDTLNLNLSDAEFDAAWNEMLLDLPKARIALLTELSAHYRLLLFSNTNEIHFSAFRSIIESAYGNSELLETIFHKTYYSHLIGARKPDESAFRFILKDQNISAGEVLFIDDSLQHIIGAEKVGIKAIHLQNTDIVSLFKNA